MMSITIDPAAIGPFPTLATGVTSPAAHAPPRRLLVLQNPGRMSRHWLEGIVQAAHHLGIEYRVCELGPIWERKGTDIAGVTREMAQIIRRERIGAVLGYVLNGMVDFECRRLNDGRIQSLFEVMGVPHLMLWIDHPQWANQKMALAPELQPLLRSANNHHFFKSQAAALEIHKILGWANCYGLTVGEDPDLIKPEHEFHPEYDVAAILGSPPRLDPALEGFLDQQNPDMEAILSTVAQTVRQRLDALWQRDVPGELRAKFKAFGEAWAQRRRSDGYTASFRHLPRLAEEHGDAVDWLMRHPKTYFDAIEQLWLFGGWQRTFFLRYLAKHFRVAIFGADWSSVGLGGGDWVPHHQQGHWYARAKLAINISQAGDEEGLSVKPFEIAASGVPMVHINRKGLSDCFEVGKEVEVFDTPGEAREIIAALLADPDRRTVMGLAARRRFKRDHTWQKRLTHMFQLAGLPLSAFRTPASPASVRPPTAPLTVT